MSGSAPTTTELELTLHLTDAELCTELAQHSEGRVRHDYAAGALRIGALALRQAQSRIDAERVRAEGDRLIENLGSALAEHQRGVSEQVSASLKEYFDPQSGRFNERIERLVRKDGDLESVLRSQIGGEGSELARTLANHLGDHSPLMQLLDPAASEGLFGSLATALEKTLSAQRERILSEFSLDNEGGALARLVAELTQHHGEVGEALEKRIDAVIGEFSLDRDDSALSRLVSRVEQAQRQISSEFSLDQEGSALARMRRELLEIAERQGKANERFYGEVLEKLAEMTARKQEAARSTRHGDEFENILFAWIEARSQRAGDIATFCGNQVGRIKNCKTGDVKIELGIEHVAAGARIVVEAKEDASYKLPDALAELEEARKNRDAGVGLFVFSAVSAPPGLEPFARHGDDIVIVWDAEDPRTDVVLTAGISVAKALCARARVQGAAEAADFEAIERAIFEIQKQASTLDQISTSAQTIKNGSEKILERARIMREALAQQIAVLTGGVHDLKSALHGADQTSK
jgi:hypothetical protein